MISRETERGATINRTWFAAIFLLLGSSFFLSAGAAQSTLSGRVVKVDEYDYDLALNYFDVRWWVEELLPSQKKKVMYFIENGKTSVKKIRTLKKEYGQKLSMYAQAITERGYKTIAGSYQAKTSESCGRIGSLWINPIHEGITSDVEIQQEGFEARLIVRYEYEGEERTLEHPAIVVGTIGLVEDGANHNHFFRGEIKGKSIVLKPDLSIPGRWRKWALEDLRECTITLEPRPGNPGD